jgi:hypothetical protein
MASLNKYVYMLVTMCYNGDRNKRKEVHIVNKAEIKQAWSLIKSRRITAEHTQQHLAVYLGIKQINVSNYERMECASKLSIIESAMAYYYVTNEDVAAYTAQKEIKKNWSLAELLASMQSDAQLMATMVM